MEEYINVLLEQIRSKKARDLVGEEIRNHITDQMEDNILNGMDKEEAMAEAVKEMGDPVETGIALDRVHRPQTAWSMIILMGVISVLSVILHGVIAFHDEDFGRGYLIYHIKSVTVGFVLMIIVYRLDYSFIARYTRVIAVGFLVFLFLVLGVCEREVGGDLQFSIGGFFQVSIIYLLYLYVPLYGAVLYLYHGEGGKGIAKAFLWMIPPCLIANRIPSLSLSVELFFMMAILLTMAVYKKWFAIHVKRFIIMSWSFIVIVPIILVFCSIKYGLIGEYQIDRLKAFLSKENNDINYITQKISRYLGSSKIFGNSGQEVASQLPSYNSDYIFTFISTYYGLFIAMVSVTIILFTVYKIFSIVFRQKNQVGMLMGFGCGLVFMIMTCFNIIETLGFFPLTRTSLPFFSYGGTEMVVCYILVGIVLSVYRYKSILPAMLKKGKLYKAVLVNNKIEI
jgi:cell division protein FtsW (lipid II flippase)